MDKLNKEQRHRCMSAIKCKDTKPELLVRKFLFSRGFRYRLNHPRLPGHPDIVLHKYRTVIFVNGCFWHGHQECKYFVLPKTNVEFWSAKIERNRKRDVEEQRQLASMGWHCITIWECQLKPRVRQQTLESLVYTLSCIFLEDRKVKSYGEVEEKTLMAAELKTDYCGKSIKKSYQLKISVRSMGNINDGFIVSFWERIFRGLSYVSLFALVSFLRKEYFNKIVPKKVDNYRFVEYWVLGNLLCSVCSSLVVYYSSCSWLAILLSLYGIFRIFEIVVYQINVMLFDPYRALKEKRKYVIKSPTRLVLLLMHNYVEIVFWFTTTVISFLSIDDMLKNSWTYYLQMNFICITTFDTSEMLHSIKQENIFLLFAFLESVVGFLMTVISLARFIGLLPSVKSIDDI